MSKELKLWASGFIDGEGCFMVGKRKRVSINPTIYYRPIFSITLRQDNIQALLALQEAIGVNGHIYYKGRYKATAKRYESNPCIQGLWKSKKQTEPIVALIEDAPLHGIKRREFEVWAQAVRLMRTDYTAERQERLGELRLILQEMKRYK